MSFTTAYGDVTVEKVRSELGYRIRRCMADLRSIRYTEKYSDAPECIFPAGGWAKVTMDESADSCKLPLPILGVEQPVCCNSPVLFRRRADNCKISHIRYLYPICHFAQSVSGCKAGPKLFIHEIGSVAGAFYQVSTF